MYYTLVMTGFCLAIAVVDIKTFRIPDILLVVFALFIIILEERQSYLYTLVRFSSAMLSLLLFAAVWHYTQGMGLGDVKYATLLGYLLSPEKLTYAFITAALLGIIVYMIGVILFHWTKTTKIPFAPFLSAGAILALPVS